jgi:sulfur transfer complex TusBCD TusB component (DsrH family)
MMNGDNIILIKNGIIYNIEKEPYETNANSHKRAWFIINNINNEKNYKKLISESIIFINKKTMEY